MPGVHYVLDGEELAGAHRRRCSPASIRRTCRAIRWPSDVARYAGEWVAAVVADSRALAEDAAEAVVVEYEPLPFVLDGEEAYAPGSTLVHEAHGSNVLLDRTFVWGEVEKDFAASPHTLKHRVNWGRSSTVPIETFGVHGELGPVARDPRRLGLDPDAEISRPDRDGAEDADVVGARALRRRCRRQLRRQARHQAHGAGRLSVAAARRAGAADRGPAGEHARRRHARAGAHLRRRGRVRRPGHHPLDEDARARQRRRLCRAARRSSSASRSAPSSGRTRSRACSTRPSRSSPTRRCRRRCARFGQSPTNYAIERTVDEVANKLGLDRLEVRRRNMIRARRVSLSDPERLDLRQRRLSRRRSTRCWRTPATTS